MSVLAGWLRTLHLETEVFFRGVFCNRWGLSTSGSGFASFHLVLDGECWLHCTALDAPRRLVTHDIAIFPRDAPHVISSSPEHADLCGKPLAAGDEHVQPDGGTALACGRFRLARQRTNLVFEALPDCLVVSLGDDSPGSWLRPMLKHVLSSVRSQTAEDDVIVERCIELLFVEVVRRHVCSAPQEAGIIAALRDPYLHRALAAVHREPARAWNLNALANEAALSRTAFCQRFLRVMGRPPMRYVAQYRMQLALKWLNEPQQGILAIALRSGYETEAAFCRAFKRETGLAPGAYRRSRAVSRLSSPQRPVTRQVLAVS
jgi:AraC family transcriptional regulator, activator of mtrCDE